MSGYIDEEYRLGNAALQAIMIRKGITTFFDHYISMFPHQANGRLLTFGYNVQIFSYDRTTSYRFTPNGCNRVIIYLRFVEGIWIATCGIYQLTLYAQKDQPSICRTEIFRFNHAFNILDQSLIVIEAHQCHEEIQTIECGTFYPENNFENWVTEWEITDPLVQYLIEQKEPAIA